MFNFFERYRRTRYPSNYNKRSTGYIRKNKAKKKRIRKIARRSRRANRARI